MEKSELSLNTYGQSVVDFKFWVIEAANAHRFPEKEILKMFVSGLKREIFHEEIYSRAFETLMGVMAETRHELENYRDIMEMSERIKRPESRKDSKDRSADTPIPRKQTI